MPRLSSDWRMERVDIVVAREWVGGRPGVSGGGVVDSNGSWSGCQLLEGGRLLGMDGVNVGDGCVIGRVC